MLIVDDAYAAPPPLLSIRYDYCYAYDGCYAPLLPPAVVAREDGYTALYGAMILLYKDYVKAQRGAYASTGARRGEVSSMMRCLRVRERCARRRGSAMRTAAEKAGEDC